jgi:hypothetical protein
MGESDVQAEQRVDVVYSFCGDRGREGLELRVKDMRRAETNGTNTTNEPSG